MLTGVGTLPDGTTLVYQYLTLSDGKPMEIALTPAQARNFAEGLIGIVDRNPDYQNVGPIRFPVEGIVTHKDLHQPPQPE
jgi:hypothetical protein